VTAEPMVLEGEWVDEALEYVAVFAALDVPFSADDLRRVVRTPPHPNAVGTVFKIAHRRGWITPTNYIPSTNPSRRGGALRQWMGSPRPVGAEAA